MWKQNNFETLWQEEANLWIKKYLIITEFNSCIISQHSFIHQKHTFWKGSLFFKLKFLRISQALSCKHFWTNILLLLLQTANTMVETRAWARVTSGVTQIWRDTSRWCHDHRHAASVSRWCDEDPEGSRRPGVVSGDWAQKTRDVIIKRGALKTNEFLHVALIKTTRDN